MTKIKAAMSALIRPLIEPHVGDLEVDWFTTKDEALAVAPSAEIGWFDMYDKQEMFEVIEAATNLKWLNSIYAGVDGMPLEQLKAQGTIVTNGTGINAITIAEYVIMGILTIAKGYDDVLRAADKQEWLLDSPGKMELAESKALLLGAGAIGGLIKTRLQAFDVEVTTVRRTPSTEDEIGPDDWRDRLGEFDWVILAVPATEETDGMIGKHELDAMKNTACIVNIARGTVIDQPALVNALKSGGIGHAFLDVTDPEPLPPDHELWSLPNAHITMHLSGRAQDKMFIRSAERFVANLVRYQRGEAVEPQVNLDLGY